MPKWNLSWVFVLSVLVLGARADSDLPPYRLKQIENPDFRKHRFGPSRKRLGLKKMRDLDPYRCDGEREFELLPELVHPNVKADSLRINLYHSKETVLYRDGTLFSSDGTAPASDAAKGDVFVKYVMSALTKLESLPSGKTMIDRLEHSPYPLVIRFTDPHFWAADDSGKPLKGMMMAQAIQFLNTLRWPEYGDQFDRVGAGGEIGFNPKLASLFVEDDGVKRPAQAHTILGHEMMHAFDGVRGLLDRRQINGRAYEYQEVSEYRATFFENRVRKESGLHYRKYYGDGPTPEYPSHGSLLGKDGEPMLIPAPCIGTPDPSAD